MLNRIARTSSLLSILAWIGPLVVYVATMRRSVDYWDTGEMQTVPWIFGIAHPTGFPSFVLGGFIFSHLVPISTVAFRMTLFSALAMSGAAWLLFVAARELRISPPIACMTAWLFACSNLAWSRGTRTEVHALAIAASAALCTLALRFIRVRDLRLLSIIAATAGIGLAVHPVVLFALLATTIILAVGLLQKPSLLQDLTASQRHRLIITCIGGLALAPLLYLSIPLRSINLSATHADPTLTLGLPPGRPYWDYGHPSTLSNFIREISGSDFSVGGGVAALFQPSHYMQIPSAFLGPEMADLGLLSMLCALFGLLTLAHRIPWPAVIGLIAGGVLAVVFATSYSSEGDVARYYLIALWILMLCFASGTQTLIERIVQRFPTCHLRRMELLGTLVLLMLLFQRLSQNGPSFWQQPHDPGAEPFIERVIATTPDHAIIIANWVYAPPLAYAAYVEKRLGARIIETAWPAQDAPYIPAWVHKRPVVIVDAGGALPATVSLATPLDQGSPSLLRVTRVITKR